MKKLLIMSSLILVMCMCVYMCGCSTMGNRTSTFTYDHIEKVAVFDGRTDEKITCKLPDGTELVFDRTGGEGILAKILAILSIMPKMEVGTD